MDKEEYLLKHQPGFTLVEVLIAMLILLVGLLGIASMQITAMRGNQHARESTERTIVANNLMEWLVSLPFNHNNLRTEEDTLDDVDTHTLTVENDGSYTMVPNDDAAPPDQLIPHPGGARNDITSVSWVVYIGKDEDGDGADEFIGYVDTNGNEIFDGTPGEWPTSKLIEITVNWENGGSTTISNIRAIAGG